MHFHPSPLARLRKVVRERIIEQYVRSPTASALRDRLCLDRVHRFGYGFGAVGTRPRVINLCMRLVMLISAAYEPFIRLEVSSQCFGRVIAPMPQASCKVRRGNRYQSAENSRPGGSYESAQAFALPRPSCHYQGRNERCNRMEYRVARVLSALRGIRPAMNPYSHLPGWSCLSTPCR